MNAQVIEYLNVVLKSNSKITPYAQWYIEESIRLLSSDK